MLKLLLLLFNPAVPFIKLPLLLFGPASSLGSLHSASSILTSSRRLYLISVFVVGRPIGWFGGADKKQKDTRMTRKITQIISPTVLITQGLSR
jgi:hypothetical protein